MKTVIIDNYDSFTFNLVHYIEEILDERPVVLRNDAFEISELSDFDIIVLSPGPGLPEEAGKLMEVIASYASSKIILGICLGHQALGIHFGAKLKNLDTVHHGVSSEIEITEKDHFFNNISNYEVGRYHSWVIDNKTLSSPLICTSKDDNGEIMSIKHESLPIHGLQYHPESVLSPEGKNMLANFFDYYKN